MGGRRFEFEEVTESRPPVSCIRAEITRLLYKKWDPSPPAVFLKEDDHSCCALG